MSTFNKLKIKKNRLLLLVVILIFLSKTNSLAQQEERIIIDGTIAGSSDNHYAYIITGNVDPEFHKGRIENGHFEVLLNKQLKDTILHSGVFLSKLITMDKVTYEKELKAKRINAAKDLYWFIIDSTSVNLKINPSNNKIITHGGEINKEQALYDSIITDYYRVVKLQGMDYANKKRVSATLNVINDHKSSLLAAENLRNLIWLPLPGGAYPYRNEIDLALKGLNSKTIGERRIENMQILYGKMLKRYTPKSNIQFPVVNFFNSHAATVSFTDVVEDCDFILVDFWATWCGPCRQQHPQLKKIQEQYKNNKKLKIIGISVDKKIKPWRDYLKNNPFNYTQYWVDANTYKVFEDKIGIETIPCYVLINAKTGVITDFNIGIDNIVAKFKENGL